MNKLKEKLARLKQFPDDPEIRKVQQRVEELNRDTINAQEALKQTEANLRKARSSVEAAERERADNLAAGLEDDDSKVKKGLQQARDLEAKLSEIQSSLHTLESATAAARRRRDALVAAARMELEAKMSELQREMLVALHESLSGVPFQLNSQIVELQSFAQEVGINLPQLHFGPLAPANRAQANPFDGWTEYLRSNGLAV